MTAKIRAVDLFCGVGGLTHGLIQGGVEVVAGYDLDTHCEFPYETSNAAEFRAADVAKITPEDIDGLFGDADVRLLAGCAPCQPFSTYSHGKKAKEGDERWQLLDSFVGLVENTLPELVTMENVTGLRKHDVFAKFVRRLQACGYHVNANDLYGPNVGLPQTRKRLVVLASRLGWPKLKEVQAKPLTVRNAIGDLRPIKAGEEDVEDPLHRASGVSSVQLARIKASKPGGSWRDWPEHLKANCHAQMERASYVSVYGRMEWDKPSPTITTQFYGVGHGRFGHPEQDRAITPREAALIQGFPPGYAFIGGRSQFAFNRLGRMIGNAVPVPFGRLIAESFVDHVREKA